MGFIDCTFLRDRAVQILDTTIPQFLVADGAHTANNRDGLPNSAIIAAYLTGFGVRKQARGGALRVAGNGTCGGKKRNEPRTS